MAAPLSPISEERVPQCGLCLGPLKDPRVLSCLDVFCAGCLEKHFREPTSGKGVCPKCQENITFPEGGSTALRPAPHIQCLADVISAQGDGQCRMCSGARTAERYCVDCRLPLCSACEKIHGLVKGAKSHAVVAMGDGVGEGAATEVSSVLKNRQAECPHHPSQVCRKFCCTCQSLVCGECCEGKHASHQVEPLGLVAGRRRQSLHDLQASVLEYKTGLKTFQHEAHKYLTGMRDEFARVERHVQEHAQRLRELATERQKAALEILSKRKQEEEDLVQSHLDSLQLTSKKVEQAGQFLDGVMAYACDAEIPEFTAFLRSRYREIRDNEKFLLHRKIKVRLHGPGLERPAMETLLRVEVEVRSPEPASATLVSTFRTDGSITGLAATHDDNLVVTSYCSKRFLVLSRHGKQIREVKTGLTQPISVCVFPPDRIFITDYGDGQAGMGIREFSCSGQALGNVSLPDRPWGIALAANGDRVVCHPERRQVVIYNSEGDLKRLIKSEGGKYLFSNPRCVAININHDIVVSDFAKHNIRVFDEEGKLKATFGSEGSGAEQLKHPCGVVCDRAGNILVADSDNRRVQLLGPNARFLTSLLTSQHGLDDPVALAVDRKGYLWVGEWSGKVHVVRY